MCNAALGPRSGPHPGPLRGRDSAGTPALPAAASTALGGPSEEGSGVRCPWSRPGCPVAPSTCAQPHQPGAQPHPWLSPAGDGATGEGPPGCSSDWR